MRPPRPTLKQTYALNAMRAKKITPYTKEDQLKVYMSKREYNKQRKFNELKDKYDYRRAFRPLKRKGEYSG